MVMVTDPALAEVYRGSYLEAVHHGAIAVVDADGARLFTAGDVDSPMLARSALKPLQAVAMLRHGLDVRGAELALTGASHSGEPFHLDAARSILDGAGLSPNDLQNTPGLPLDEEALRQWLVAGHGKEPIAQGCSGKHAGMLRTCVRAGWPSADYLDPQHPLQVAIRDTLAEFMDEAIGQSVTDGCGAPAFPSTLAGLALGYARLAGGRDDDARAVAEAFRRHPEYVSGTRRDEVVFHREVPGLVCKMGAEGTLVAGLGEGIAVAIKISDGAHRATVPAMVAVLSALGLSTPRLEAFQRQPVLGHGRKVGHIVAHRDLPGMMTGLGRERDLRRGRPLR